MSTSPPATGSAGTRAPAASRWSAPGRGGAVGMVLGGILSVQFGGALAATMFDRAGPAGMVTLRLGGAALVLLLLVRPRWRGHSRADWAVVGAFGVSLAAMNALFYEALARMPIGAAVTVEFLGPLGLAAVLSRRLRHVGWVLMAATGVLLLGYGSLTGLDPVGVAFALGAGVCWAGYILLSARTGRRFPGLDGLALASALAAVLVLPIGLASAGPALAAPDVLLVGLAVALLSSVVPYALELTALRALASRVFGVLMSLEPAAAALAGLLVLGQLLTPLQLLAVALVVVASIGAARSPAAAAVGP
ncbi:EamA family transporter [Geodermatophilus sp. YIM 151500]|uniref:EamA family transporter n=1 Tax=Geodermatophilus sp. YIM 151500 TaxID=2984531 RepID=UPI0021E48E5A|nr:EamA family transporter [Geodermatophilus sp. YIM 151500]MCV2489875.1 EamA family transporter [Geodermatophilus sp. YIM 151500]